VGVAYCHSEEERCELDLNPGTYYYQAAAVSKGKGKVSVPWLSLSLAPLSASVSLRLPDGTCKTTGHLTHGRRPSIRKQLSFKSHQHLFPLIHFPPLPSFPYSSQSFPSPNLAMDFGSTVSSPVQSMAEPRLQTFSLTFPSFFQDVS